MTQTSAAPNVAELDIPMDRWSEPFWDAAGDRRLVFPRCSNCQTFRWPPGPFCPQCRSQETDWVSAGPGRVFSFTLVRGGTAEAPEINVPALIEFPAAGGIRLLAAIVGAVPQKVAIGAEVEPEWISAQNAVVPVFRLAKASR